MTADSYLTVASLLAGFGVTVLMFRIQRELYVLEKDPPGPTWLAWADYLVIVAIVQSLLLVVLPLIVSGGKNAHINAVAAGGCASAVALVAAYPVAILDHYRIEWGKEREPTRAKGEPLERIIVICAALVGAGTFGAIVVSRW